MEIESTNHQDVAEPDQMASGVAGTGQKNETETGIDEHETREFSLLTGFECILHEPENPDGFSCSLAIGQIAGTTLNPAALTRELSPASLKKSRKNKLVIGMGVLYNGEIKPAVNRSYTTAPVVQDVEEKLEDLFISLYEQQDRMLERATKKIDRLNSQLTALEKQRRLV